MSFAWAENAPGQVPAGPRHSARPKTACAGNGRRARWGATGQFGGQHAGLAEPAHAVAGPVACGRSARHRQTRAGRKPGQCAGPARYRRATYAHGFLMQVFRQVAHARASGGSCRRMAFWRRSGEAQRPQGRSWCPAASSATSSCAMKVSDRRGQPFDHHRQRRVPIGHAAAPLDLCDRTKVRFDSSGDEARPASNRRRKPARVWVGAAACGWPDHRLGVRPSRSSSSMPTSPSSSARLARMYCSSRGDGAGHDHGGFVKRQNLAKCVVAAHADHPCGPGEQRFDLGFKADRADAAIQLRDPVFKVVARVTRQERAIDQDGARAESGLARRRTAPD